MMLVIASPAWAQGVDWDKIGRPLGEDTSDIYDRYVYFDESKTADTNVPLDKPLLSLQGMRTWVEENLPQLITLTAQNHAQELRDNKIYFSEKGFRAFLAFLGENKISDNVMDNNLDLTVMLENSPNILADSVFNGVYRWNIDLPLMLSYRGRSAEQSRVTINMDIIRVPFGQNADGLAIDHWQIKKNENETFAEEKENLVDDLSQDEYQ